MGRAVSAQNNTAAASHEEYDESYTVTQLRDAAKKRGIQGYSTMSKAELLEALNCD